MAVSELSEFFEFCGVENVEKIRHSPFPADSPPALKNTRKVTVKNQKILEFAVFRNFGAVPGSSFRSEKRTSRPQPASYATNFYKSAGAEALKNDGLTRSEE